MLGYYLWLIPCFQAALINAAGDESEHIHIKVHVPDINRKQTPNYRVHQYQQHKQQQHPISLQQFHYPGAATGGRTRTPMPEELMDSMDSYGPVLFNNDIATSTVDTQHPVMSKQLMRQLFTPEMMSVITGNEHTSQEMNDVDSHHLNVVNGSPLGRPVNMESNDFLGEYLQQFNRQQAPKFSTKISNKRKKYSYGARDEPNEQLEFQPFYSTSITQYLPHQQQQQQQQFYQHGQQQQKQKQQTRQSSNQRYQQRHQNFNPLQWGFEDESDEFETAEDISSSASASDSDSNEDMTTAFNKQQPISYQDMYGAYATPLTSSTSTGQHSLSFPQLTTAPTYSNDWRQYHHQQRPEVQKQKQQLPRKQQQRYKQKQKFVLPSTTLRLTTSSSSSATSPISNGLTSVGTGSITSTGTIPWTLPYEFVQKSQQQQQQQQHLEAQKYQQQQYKQQKLPSHKKRKNRNKRKRTRIIVE